MSYGYDMFQPNDWIDLDDILAPELSPYVQQPSTLTPPASAPALATSGADHRESFGNPTTRSCRGCSWKIGKLREKISEQEAQDKILWIIVVICICIILNLKSQIYTLQCRNMFYQPVGMAPGGAMPAGSMPGNQFNQFNPYQSK
jgi:hypothetical protein